MYTVYHTAYGIPGYCTNNNTYVQYKYKYKLKLKIIFLLYRVRT